MYKDFTVKNFRGFRELHIGSLKRVNLIMGKNNVGKTALLEAICIHAGRNNPELAVRLQGMRGRKRFPLDPAAIWGWLFHKRRMDEPIEAVGIDEQGGEWSARITLANTSTIVSAAPDLGSGTHPSDISPTGSVLSRELLIEYQGRDGKPKACRAFVDPNENNKLKLKFDEPESPVPLVYICSRAGFDEKDAERFSSVDSEGGIDGIVDILRHMDDRLIRLSLGYEGKEPVVKGDIGIGELMPVHDIGQGTCRCLQIMLAICVAKNGIVFVDEVENGIHHSVMHGLWKAIAYLVKETEHNVQVIATTHSRECAKAAYEAFNEVAPDDLGVYRLERLLDETVEVITYDMETLEQSFASGFEVR